MVLGRMVGPGISNLPVVLAVIGEFTADLSSLSH
jgi:hypothetical protein